MTYTISKNDRVLDIEFYKATVKILQFRNKHPKKDKFHFSELRRVGGSRTESVLIEMNAQNLCGRQDENGMITIAQEKFTEDYLASCQNILKEMAFNSRALKIKVRLGVAGFVISILALCVSVLTLLLRLGIVK